MKKVLNDERGFIVSGTLAALIGAGALGGGAAWLGSKKKSKEQQYPSAPQYTMPEELPYGKSALDTLTARSKGQGVAFGQDQLGQFQTPYATAMQDQFQRHTLPAIESAQGAANIAGTPQGVGQRVGAQQDVSNQIAMNWQDFMKWNEALKQQGITGGVSGLQNFTQMGLGQKNLQAGADYQSQVGQFGEQQRAIGAQADRLPNALSTAGGVMSALSPQPDYSKFFESQQPATSQTLLNSAKDYYEGQGRSWGDTANILKKRKRLL